MRQLIWSLTKGSWCNLGPLTTKVTDIAHRISMLSDSGLAISAVEPTTAGVNEFWSGDRVSANVVLDALRPGGVTICAGPLRWQELDAISRSEKLERPMSSSGL
jgi:hypothetical protein